MTLGSISCARIYDIKTAVFIAFSPGVRKVLVVPDSLLNAINDAKHKLESLKGVKPIHTRSRS